MKKRGISLILALCLLISGCGINANTDDKADTVSEVTASENKLKDNSEGTKEAGNDGIVYDDGSPWIDSDLKVNIDNSVRPDEKDDFHFAVNYDWLKETEIANERTSESSFTLAEDAVIKRAKELMGDDSLTGHDAELVRSLYRAVTDWDMRNELGIEPVKPVISDIAGIKTLDELSDFICDPVRSNCVDAFVSIANEVYLLDSRRYIVYINNDTLLLEDAAWYSDMTPAGEMTYKAKKELATSMLERLGMTEEEAVIRFDAVMGFEEKIAEVSLTRADYSSPDVFYRINNVYTEDEINKLTVNFPLKDFIDGFGYSNAKEYAIYQPKVIKRLDELYTEDNLGVMKDYMMIRYLLYSADKLDRECYDMSVRRMNMQYGTTGSPDDETAAFNTIFKLIPEPLCRVYLEKYDAAGMKEDITGMCREIIDKYIDMLDSSKLLSEETARTAQSKLKKIKINAVYPDKWIGYETLDLKGLSYLECARAINSFNMNTDRSRTGCKVDKELWTVNILDCNAYYNKQDNSINIILGILDDAFYRPDMSREEMLGGIGTVIGHEISHAFDDKGAQFDEDGNLKSWWNGNDYKAYGEKTAALVRYYDGVRGFNGVNESGNNVMNEAVADITGMKVILDIAGEEDDFDYDKFFKQYARLWKTVMTPEAEYDKLTNDHHPLNYLRTNVTVQQYDEFYKTYGINEGDGMYLAPDDRITVW